MEEGGASEPIARAFFKIGGCGDRVADAFRAGSVIGPALISDSVEESCGLR